MAPKSRPKRKRKQRRYSEHEKNEALTLYESDGPTAVFQQLGIPKSTIRTWAKAAGTRTVRNEKMIEARAAAEIDAAKLRAEASSFAIQGAQAAFQKLYERITTDDDISFKDLGIIGGILADKHLAFNHVNDDGGTAETESLLDQIAEQIGGHLDAD